MSGSHEQWANGYAASSTHNVDVIGMPSGQWRWRLRAGAAPLARMVASHVKDNGVPHVLLVSGLVDVAQLMGYLRRVLPERTAVVVYQHESQLLYPTTSGGVDEEAALRNWSSWVASDLVVFNSEFHRSAIREALPRFLAHQPELDQLPFLDDALEKFVVTPVGVDPVPAVDTAAEGRAGIGSPPVILWPHRWEPDKDPDAFARALVKLDDRGLDFRLVLAGEDAMVPSQGRREVVERWADRIVATGPFPRRRYLEVLAESDIVVSCASHEFFGVAVVEAMSAGCVPVLPEALAYPELIPDEWKELALYQRGRFGTRLVDVVSNLGAYRRGTSGLAESMQRFGWSEIAKRLDGQLESCWRRIGSKG